MADEFRLANQSLAGLPDDINNAAALRDFELRAWAAIKYGRSITAYKILKHLLAQIKSADANWRNQYQAVLVWLYYGALDNLGQAELLDFFRNYDLSVIFKDEFYNDLIGQVKVRLSLEPVETRDGWREKIYNALHENSQLLSLRFSEPAEKGTIGNWLKLYDGAIGLAPAESLALAEFENEAARLAGMSATEKLVLKRFLEFYEFIKLSSLEPAGFEEDIIVSEPNGSILLSGGDEINLLQVESELKRLATNLTPPAPLISGGTSDRVPAVAVASTFRFSPVAVQARALLAETNGDVKVLRDRLDAAVQNKSREPGLALILLLAQLRQLDNLLSDDERFSALVSADLKDKGQDDMLQGFGINPTAPNFIARFLRLILQEKLGLAESDALAFAEKLAAVLALEGEKYSKIVTRGEDGGLKWNL